MFLIMQRGVKENKVNGKTEKQNSTCKRRRMGSLNSLRFYYITMAPFFNWFFEHTIMHTYIPFK